MSNPYMEYYVSQAGSGLTAYSGYRYQRGHGFFGSLWNILKPLGKYLGKKFLSTGVSIGSDYLSGDNIKESAKKRLKAVGEEVLDDSVIRAKKFIQTGKGKRRRVMKSKKTKRIKKKSSKKAVKKMNKKKKRSVRKKKLLKSHLSHLF